MVQVEEAERGSEAGWRDASILRCRRALRAATAPADRGALLRTLAWLRGGRVDPSAEGVTLTSDDEPEQARFGVRIVPDRSALWLLDDIGPKWWPSNLHVDPRDRRGVRPGFADAALRRLTDRTTYRSLAQKAAVRALLTQPPGSGLLASMPTGAGKSLVFQMAALRGREVQPGACVVVIVPTVALALDHQRSLARVRGLEGSLAVTGDLAPGGVREALDAFRRGEVPILLLGPEMALRDDVQASLAEAAAPRPLAFGLNGRLTHLVVDEAHIVESWGRNFRPDFQRLPDLLSRLRIANLEVRLVLLSATLPPAARALLRCDWGFGAPWLEVDARVPRYEHDVVVASFPHPDRRDEALDWVMDRVPRPTILYTTEVEAAEALHRRLGTRGHARLALFTGDSTAEARRAIVAAWADDDLDIVVATSAFGMGVDKPDVRSIVHACLPEGPSRWYQEIGRAARDGGQGVAVLLFTDRNGRDDDVDRARSLAMSGWLTRDLAEGRWTAMMDGAARREWVGAHLRVDVNLDAVREGLAPRPSDYNRMWNRSLLMLMQRAGVVRITSVVGSEGAARQAWGVEVRDPDLLGGLSSVWDRIFVVRERERLDAKAMFEPFASGVRYPRRDCLTRLAFELIEPLARVPPCGRCPDCRSHKVEPPTDLASGGLNAAWADAPPALVGLIPGLLLVEATDPTMTRGLGLLLRRLTALGVRQWVLPDALAEEAASQLARVPRALGLVMTFGEWSDAATLANLPTALILPVIDHDVDEIVARFVGWTEGSPARSGVLVAEPSRRVRGRRLDQWASRSAPIAEAALPTPSESVEVPS